MISEAERMRLTNLFADAIALLCRSGLPFGAAVRVDALIGVTLSGDEVLLVNVNKKIASDEHADEEVNHGSKRDTKSTETEKPQDIVRIDSSCAILKLEPSDSPVVDGMPIIEAVNPSAVCADAKRWNETKLDDEHLSVEDFGFLDPANLETTDLNFEWNDPDIGNNRLIAEMERDGHCPVMLNDDQHIESTLVKSEVTNNVSREMNTFTNDTSHPFEALAHPTSSLSSGGPAYKYLKTSWFHGAYKSGRTANTRPFRKFGSGEVPSLQGAVSSQMFSSQTSLPDNHTASSAMYVTSADVAHNMLKLDRTSLSCHVCGAVLRGRQTLHDHIRGTHLSIYSYRCDDCGLTFKWRSTLKNHRVVCPNVRPVQDSCPADHASGSNVHYCNNQQNKDA